MTENNTTLLYCDCAYCDTIPEEKKRDVLTGLTEAGAAFDYVPDLCRLSAAKKPALAKYAKAENLKVIACYPRAVKWLFDAAGVALPDNAEVLNLHTQSAGEIVARVSGRKTEAAPQTPLPKTSRADWVPWFPVVDYSKCSNCQQCLSFCLFGVYELSPDGRVTVENPQNCKNNCPACARICPEAAIMFPKLQETPINGAEIGEEALAGANMRVDIEDIIGEDVYETLMNRRIQTKKRRLLKQQDLDKAIEERGACACNEIPAPGAVQTQSQAADCDCVCDCDPETKDCETCEKECDCDCRIESAEAVAAEEVPCCGPGETCDEPVAGPAAKEESNPCGCSGDSGGECEQKV